MVGKFEYPCLMDARKDLKNILATYEKELKELGPEKFEIQVGWINGCSCGRIHPLYLRRNKELSVDTGWY